jgi:hypothetical protein
MRWMVQASSAQSEVSRRTKKVIVFIELVGQKVRCEGTGATVLGNKTGDHMHTREVVFLSSEGLKKPKGLLGEMEVPFVSRYSTRPRTPPSASKRLAYCLK